MSDDLAAAFYAEMCSKATAAEALNLWQRRRIGPADPALLDDMAAVLAAVTRHAIDRALCTGRIVETRRQEREQMIAAVRYVIDHWRDISSCWPDIDHTIQTHLKAALRELEAEPGVTL